MEPQNHDIRVYNVSFLYFVSDLCGDFSRYDFGGGTDNLSVGLKRTYASYSSR